MQHCWGSNDIHIVSSARKPIQIDDPCYVVWHCWTTHALMWTFNKLIVMFNELSAYFIRKHLCLKWPLNCKWYWETPGSYRGRLDMMMKNKPLCIWSWVKWCWMTITKMITVMRQSRISQSRVETLLSTCNLISNKHKTVTKQCSLTRIYNMYAMKELIRQSQSAEMSVEPLVATGSMMFILIFLASTKIWHTLCLKPG